MTETLYAFMALAVAAFFAMSQMRASAEGEREIASIELELLAHAVGSETMQFLSKMPYDARTADRTVNPQNQVLTALTPVSGFGSGADCTIPGTCQDLDDFNAMKPDTVFFQVGTDDVGDPTGFDFEVTASVQYIDEDGTVSTTPTWTKEVTLWIEQAVVGDEKKFQLAPVMLKRQFSPQWR